MASALASLVLCGLLVTADSPSPAGAVPGTPGVPQAPSLVFDEQFENNLAGVPISALENYVGVQGQTTTNVNPYWLRHDQCNGVINSYAGLVNASDYNGWCGDANGPNQIRDMQTNARRLADVLGQVQAGVVGSTSSASPVNGSTTATQANHAVTEWTSRVSGPNNAVVYQTTPIAISASSSRFYLTSIDVAETSCTYNNGSGNSRLDFFFLLNGTPVPITSAPIRACTDSRARFFTSPLPANGQWGSGGNHARAGRFYTDSSSLLTPAQISSFAIRLTDQTGTSEGNDFGFDNIRVYDATPQLDKAFSPQIAPYGGVSTLTLTVTNTTDLARKAGWAFTDNLPAGLKVANPANLGGTCTGTKTAAPGGTSVSITNGVLNAGQASCTITVDVIADPPAPSDPDPKTFENCAANISNVVGVDLPNCATVQFVKEPALTIDKTSSAGANSKVGDVVTYSVELKNTGLGDWTAGNPATFTDNLSNVLDDADWNNDAAVSFDMDTAGTPPTLTGTTLNWSGPLKAGETATFTYSVTLKAGGNGTVTNTACIAGNICDSTTTSLPKLTIEKSVNSTQPPSTWWDTDYTYTLVVRNNGPGAATAQNPASVEDDLMDVLDDAEFVQINSTVLSSPSGSTPAATFNAVTKKLTWSGPLAVGQTVTIRYTVKYKLNMTGNRELYNRACIPADLAQDPSARCDEVTIPPNAGTIQSWKSSDPPPGTELAAGDTVTYTLHFKNNETSIWGRTVDHEDVLTEVLDDADVISGPTASNPALTVTAISNGRFKVTGTVPAATTYTVSYTVRVKADGQRGNSRLDNFVVPTGTNPPGTCVPTGSQHPNCTTHPVLGSVIWGKTGAQSERIGGSEWTITGPSGSASQAVTVVDCEAANAADCTGADRDPRAGYLEVTQLAWGDYTLVEAKAPLGYVLDPTPRPFTIGGGATQQRVDLGGIVNERQTALIIPLTGGLGADWFLFGGGGTLAALLALISIRAHRRNRAFAGPGRP